MSVTHMDLVIGEATHRWLNANVPGWAGHTGTLSEAVAFALEGIMADARALRALSTPEIAGFLSAVEREALYQRQAKSTNDDAGKSDADWLFLLGYLGGKAVAAGTAADAAMMPSSLTLANEKRLHRIIAMAAVCLNWHAARVGAHTGVRPGIATPEGEDAA